MVSGIVVKPSYPCHHSLILVVFSDGFGDVKQNVCHKICSKTQLRLGHHFLASGFVYAHFHHFFTTGCSLCLDHCPLLPRDRFIEVTSPRPQLGRTCVQKKYIDTSNQTQPLLSRHIRYRGSQYVLINNIYIYIY